MITKMFSVADYAELLAMQRVFREAKFCGEPDDEEVAASPIVAGLFRRLMEALIAADIERYGTRGKQRWDEWLTIDASRQEWCAALARAKKQSGWKNWNDAARASYVADLLAPFIVSDDRLREFLVAVSSDEPELSPEA